MIKIIGDSSTGKTGRLFLLAVENNGIIVCKNTDNMRIKAHDYGLTGIEFMSYETYIDTIKHCENTNRRVYIDDMSEFLKVYDRNITGYAETV